MAVAFVQSANRLMGAIDGVCAGKRAPFLKNEAIVQQSTFFNEFMRLLNLRRTAQPLAR